MIESAGADSRRSQRSRLTPLDVTLIVITMAVLASRVLALQPSHPNRENPFLSANDRSRWATIRALGDDGTYEIDALLRQDRETWDTIDKVAHEGRDGRLHYYSSKPTLLPTLLAWQYRLVRRLTGWSLDERPFSVVRTMLLVSQVLPMGLMLLCVAWVIRDRGASDWTTGFLILALGLGTYLSAFVVTLNNHLPAAVAAGVVAYLLWRRSAVWRGVGVGAGGETLESRRATIEFAMAGAAAAFAAANELPALSLAVLAALLFALIDLRRWLVAFAPMAALVAIGSVATNWEAHQSWRPAYAHRTDGALLASLDAVVATELEQGNLGSDAEQSLKQQGFMLPDLWSIDAGQSPVPEGTHRWVLTDLNTGRRWALVQPAAGNSIEVRGWDQWYEYPGSYWTRPAEQRSRVDRGEPSRWAYAFHMTLGHHGILSLTPWWLLAIAGACLGLGSRHGVAWRLGVAALLLLTLVCFAFYVARPLIDRNYGGQCSALRWMFWFAPLWTLVAADAVERLSQTAWGRGLALVLLAASVVSAGQAASNPWVHPWIASWWFGF